MTTEIINIQDRENKERHINDHVTLEMAVDDILLPDNCYWEIRPCIVCVMTLLFICAVSV